MRRRKLEEVEIAHPITFPIAFYIDENGDPAIDGERRIPRAAIDVYKPKQWPLLIALSAFAWFIIKHRCDPQELDRLFTKRIAHWTDIKNSMKVE